MGQHLFDGALERVAFLKKKTPVAGFFYRL
jgi:hypothetical protein